MRRFHIAIVSACAGMMLGTPLQGQIEPQVSRRVEAIAAVPTADGSCEVRAVISISVDTVSPPVDLSTEVEIRAVHAGGAGFECLIWDVDDGSVYSEYDECGCTVAVLVSPPLPSALQPEDYIEVLLRPAPARVPESDMSDDQLTLPFDGSPAYWNRRIDSISIAPVPGGPGSFDVHVAWSVETGHLAADADLSAEATLLVNGVPVSTVPFCDGFITIPGGSKCGPSLCTGPCPDMICGTSVGPLFCSATEIQGIPTCACRSAGQGSVFPPVLVDPDDDLTVVLRPVPGALPELPGFGDDDQVTRCPGDVNGDGFVNVLDLVDLILAWGTGDANADINQDGIVDVLDLVELVLNWGPCVAV